MELFRYIIVQRFSKSSLVLTATEVFLSQILFQVILIMSGNLSFLNWLTIVPSLACFDDLSWSCLFSSVAKKRVVYLQVSSEL